MIQTMSEGRTFPIEELQAQYKVLLRRRLTSS